ncbi:hypothetical protein EP331_15385 [bacterium]|nr:MAG: hypothetical protein EP331_15385 [bacterium]
MGNDLNKVLMRYLTAIVFVLVLSSTGFAQFKTQAPSPYRNTGSVIKVEQDQKVGGLQNFFNMKMMHSYEASFSSFGGQTANLNMYTNTMLFSFNQNLTGRLDLAFAHSPFGNALPGMQQSQFFIRNAELSYKFSENTRLNVSFQQLPYSPYNFGLNNSANPYYNSIWPN